MWIPNVRNNYESLDHIPLWEKLLWPVTLVWLLWLCVKATWRFWLYPETHMHQCEFDKQQAAELARLTAYRAYRSRVGTWRRLLEKTRLVPFDRGPFDDAR